MCGPWAIPLALMVAGSGAKYIGDQQASHAREQAYSAERTRQQSLTDEQTARFQDSVAQAAAAATPAAQQRAADARESTLASVILPPTSSASYLPGAASAPAVVAAANDKAQAGAHAKSMDLAHAIAALGGTNDQLQTLNTGIARNADAIQQGNSFKTGSMGVLDDEMKAAAKKGGNLRAIGGLAQQVGQAWLTGGMGGGGGEPLNSSGLPGIY